MVTIRAAAIAIVAAGALCGCDKPGQASGSPAAAPSPPAFLAPAEPIAAAGFWEGRLSSDKAIVRVCHDKTTAAQNPVLGELYNNDVCKQTRGRLPDGSWQTVTKCNSDGKPSTRINIYRGNYASEYTSHQTQTFDGEPKPFQESVTTFKRLGECPADFKPGQTKIEF